MAKYFNENLKHIRKIRNLSQQTLADKMGVDRSMISYWENNKSDITVDNVFKLSGILRVPLPEFVGEDLTEFNDFNENDFMLDKYNKLTKEDKELINNLIDTRLEQIEEKKTDILN